MKPKLFIDGEHGTTGLQITERLSGRSDIEILSIPMEQRRDQSMRESLLREADIAILCLPDDAARESVAMVEGHGTRIIDASTAHRTAKGWVYGFPEMAAGQPDAIREARFVANPGCWPQGPIIMLRPLVEKGLIPANYPVTVNGISGYSGGGKAMIADYESQGDNAPEYLPYGLGLKHKHMPELKTYALLESEPMMQPVVGRFAQGMISSVPLQLGSYDNRPTGADIHAALADHLAAVGEGVVELMPYPAADRDAELQPEVLNNTNGMRIYVAANDEKAQVVLIAVYDNLGKGASGAAVQNLDLMIGA